MENNYQNNNGEQPFNPSNYSTDPNANGNNQQINNMQQPQGQYTQNQATGNSWSSEQPNMQQPNTGTHQQFNSVPPQNNKPPKKKKNAGVPAFLFGIFGVLLGAILSFLLLGGLQGGSAGTQGTNEEVATSDEVTTAMMEAAEAVSPTVVGISNIKSVSGGGVISEESVETEVGTGSGVIYKVEGGEAYIVTNNHVVEGADSLEVTLASGEKRPATLVGTDPFTDLAVIKMDGSGIKTVATFGDSDELQQGEPVIAIGNPLGLQFSGSVTAGVISGLDRTVAVDINGDGVTDWNAEVIQTDAAINPGNSGGALVNMQGEVIGINSMKIAESSVEGMCFAIPSNTVVQVIEDLEKYGYVQRPYLGVGLKPLSEISLQDRVNTLNLPEDQSEGVVITSVEPGSPAEDAGLQPLDVVTEINGEPTPDMPTFRQELYKNQPGDKVEITYYRNGKQETTNVTLGETPKPQ